MERNENNIQLRTSEIDAILGKSPNWIMRTGIGVICASVLILLVGSAFFYYPETISCSINITTNLPPSHLINKGGGLIEKMYVEKDDIVKRNQILAVIKNSANVDDVLWLKLVMDSISTEQYKKVIDIFEKKKNLELGDLTNSFSVLQKAIESYDIFCRLKTYEKKQQALLKEIQHTASYEQSLIKKYELENANCDIAAQAFKRDSTLFVGNAATMIEYEQAKSLLIQKKVSLMTNIAEIENIRIQKSQLSHALIENTDQSIVAESVNKRYGNCFQEYAYRTKSVDSKFCYSGSL